MAVVQKALDKIKPRVRDLVEVEERPIVPRRALTAAASTIPLDGSGWKTHKLGDLKWQKDGWHQYDINGDLRFIANWVGDACSRAEIFIAEVGADGRPGERVEDPKVQILAETLFGGPAAKAEAQRLMGIHLFVPGESYIVAEGVENANEDRWYVVSTSEVKREGSDAVKVQRPQEYGGDWYQLQPKRDLLIRVWTPHPRKPDLADSSVRPALIPLREIEQLTKYTFAQIDSRLAGAGIAFVPQEMDFPREDEDPTGAAEGLTAIMTRAMSAALNDREHASSLVPIFVEVPAELIGKLQHMSFETPLSERIEGLQEAATRKLARCLDIDPEILTGKGETNHWSAWQIEESTIRLFVSSKLARMCDALTKGYLAAALKVLGKDPEKFCFWYSTDALTVTPDRQGDALELYDKGLINQMAVRSAGNWSEEEAPDDAERERELARKMVELDPALIREAPIQKALGISWKLSEPAPPALPAGLDGANSPDQPGGNGNGKRQVGQQAPREIPQREQSVQQAALMVGAHGAIQRTLELVGKRLLTREQRGRHDNVATFELHTRIHVLDDAHARELVNSALPDLAVTAAYAEVDPDMLTDLVGTYCLELVKRHARHDAGLLATYLEAGLHAECGELCLHPAHPGRCTEAARAYALGGEALVAHGTHNQKDHGRRKTRPDFLPFTPSQRRERRAAARKKALELTAPRAGKKPKGKEALEGWRRFSDFNDDAAYRERINAVVAEMKETYAFEDPQTGLRTDMSGVIVFDQHPSGVKIQFPIRDSGGNHVGDSQRSWQIYSGDTPDAPMRFIAHHDALELEPHVQGGGFGTRFNAQAERVYRENDAEAISLSANIDVGGYAWARAGYDFVTGYEGFSAQQVAKRIRSAVKRSRVTLSSEDEAVLQRAESGDNDLAPRPIELARLGWREGANNWPGREGMLGSDWFGVKYLSGPRAVAAAASREVPPSSPDPVLAAVADADLAWSVQFADDTPLDPYGRHPNAEGVSDYNEHHHRVSPNAGDDAEFWAHVADALGDPLTAAGWGAPDLEQFHLPGRHDQKTHGHRRGRIRSSHLGGRGVLTEAEKLVRARQRRSGFDPDRDASAPDRQGRRAFAEWSLHAQRLSKEAKREVGEEARRLREDEDGKRKPGDSKKEGREAEWEERERKLRATYERKIKNIQSRVGDDILGDGEILTQEDADDTIESIRAVMEGTIERERLRFFSENPAKIEAKDSGSWFDMLVTDTPRLASGDFDPAKAVPVDNVKVQYHQPIKTGFAFRHNGTTIMVETTGYQQVSRNRAAKVAGELVAMADEVLPPGWEKTTNGIAWSAKRSTDDAAAAKRYGARPQDFFSAASADLNTILLYNKGFSGGPSSKDRGYLRHEHGHNVDNKHSRMSSKKEWADAAQNDFALNNPGTAAKPATRSGTRVAQVRDYVARDVPGTHKIDPYTRKGYGSNRVDFSEGVTNYGKSTPGEDFAESVALYFAGPIGSGRMGGSQFMRNVYFRDLFPARAKLLDALYPAAAKAQKAQIKAERN